MTFDSGRIRYYNDDANNTLAWELGGSGTIQLASTDIWYELYMVPIDGLINIKIPEMIHGTKYLVFNAGDGSAFSAYDGLTVIGSITTNTTPDTITSSQRIPGNLGQTTLGFILPGTAQNWYTENNGRIYRRIIDNYTNGHRTAMDCIYFNDSGQETDEDGFVIVP